jgi:acylphosphatase
MATRQLRITGTVQGVGYRYAFEREAQRLGVTGWVRNRADASVEALIQGADEALDALTAWARRGPSGARVSGVASTTTAAADERAYQRFEIRPTV